MKRNPFFHNIEYSKCARHRSRAARGGFTLIELLVVIAIAAIMSALLLGGFFNMSASNKRLSCQTNLQSIYGALRMYATDNDGAYPYYNAASTNGGTVTTPTNATPEDTRFGLWALYTNDMIKTVKVPAVAPPNDKNELSFPSTRVPNNLNVPDTDFTDNPLRPVGIYLRNSGNLHCPADRDNAELYNADRTAFNPNYLSYQTLDNGAESLATPGPNVATYQSQRVTVTANANWKRQLLFWNGTQRVFDQRAASNTVITWCKWHRTGLGGRNSDPILYADGSVRSVPLTLPTLPIEMGWTR